MLRVSPFVLLVGFVLGCGGPKQWEVIVENQSEVPHSFVIDLGPDGKATAKDVGKGKRESLLLGSTKVSIRSVKVTREGWEQVDRPQPEFELEPGKKFVVTVWSDGKVNWRDSER